MSLQGQLVEIRAGVEGSGEGEGHHQHHGAGDPFLEVPSFLEMACDMIDTGRSPSGQLDTCCSQWRCACISGLSAAALRGCAGGRAAGPQGLCVFHFAQI